MQNVFITKMKNVLFFIIKSIATLFICRILAEKFFSELHSILDVFLFGIFDKIIPIDMFVPDIIVYFLQGMTFYFISKKINIIKPLDAIPLPVALLITFLFDLYIFYYPLYDDGTRNMIPLYIDLYLRRSNAFNYTLMFLSYKLIKFLNKKYPNLFNKFSKKN